MATRHTPFGEVPADWPFHGLVPLADNSQLVGRKAETEDLFDLIRLTTTSVVYGASGVGKTSLLKVGLVKELKREAEDRRKRKLPVDFVPVYFDRWHEKELFSALKVAIREHDAVTEDDPCLTAASIEDLFANWHAKRAGRLLLVFDQFEQFFLYPEEKNRTDFIEPIFASLRSLDQSISLLLAMREDSIARLDLLTRYYPDILGARRRIRPLRISQAIAVFRTLIPSWVDIDEKLVGDICGWATGAPEFEIGPKRRQNEPTVELGWIQMTLEALGRLQQLEKDLTLENLWNLPLDVKNADVVNALKDLYVKQALQEPSDDPAAWSDLTTNALKTFTRGYGARRTWTAESIAREGWKKEEHTEAVIDARTKRLARMLEVLASVERRLLRKVEPMQRVDPQEPPAFHLVHDLMVGPIQEWLDLQDDRAKRQLEIEKSTRDLVLPLSSATGYSEAMELFGTCLLNVCGGTRFYLYRTYRIGAGGLRLQSSNDVDLKDMHFTGLRASDLLIDLIKKRLSDPKPHSPIEVTNIMQLMDPLKTDTIGVAQERADKAKVPALVLPIWLLPEEKSRSATEHLAGAIVILLMHQPSDDQKHDLENAALFGAPLLTEWLKTQVLKIPRMLENNAYLPKNMLGAGQIKNDPLSYVCREIGLICMADRAQIWFDQEDSRSKTPEGTPSEFQAEWYSAEDYRLEGTELYRNAKGLPSLRVPTTIPSNGVLQRVLQTSKPCTAPTPESPSIEGNTHAKCEVAVPIGVEEWSCGVINLESYDEGPYLYQDSDKGYIDEQNLVRLAEGLNRVMRSLSRPLSDDVADLLLKTEPRHDSLGLSYSARYQRFKNFLYRGVKDLHMFFKFTTCGLYLDDKVNEKLRLVATVGCEDLLFDPETISYFYDNQTSFAAVAFKAAKDKEGKYDLERDFFRSDVKDRNARVDHGAIKDLGCVGSMLAYPILSGREVRGMLLLGNREALEGAEPNPQVFPDAILPSLDELCRNLALVERLSMPWYRRQVERQIREAIREADTNNTVAIRHLADGVLAAGFKRVWIFEGSIDDGFQLRDSGGGDPDGAWPADWLSKRPQVPNEIIKRWGESSEANAENGSEWANVPIISTGAETEPQVVGFIVADMKPYRPDQDDPALVHEVKDERKISDENLFMLTLIGYAARVVFKAMEKRRP